MDEDELKKLKQEKMADLDDQEEMQDQQEEQMRQQLKQIASQILTKEARSRLGNIRAAKPDLASQVELQLVQLHRMGQINGKIDDDQLKRILQKVQDATSDDERDIKYTTRG